MYLRRQDSVVYIQVVNWWYLFPILISLGLNSALYLDLMGYGKGIKCICVGKAEKRREKWNTSTDH